MIVGNIVFVFTNKYWYDYIRYSFSFCFVRVSLASFNMVIRKYIVCVIVRVFMHEKIFLYIRFYGF